MKIVNSEKLRELIHDLGDRGLEETCCKAEVSASLLQKMLAGSYNSIPRKRIRTRLSTFLKVPEELLFPFVASKKKAKVS